MVIDDADDCLLSLSCFGHSARGRSGLSGLINGLAVGLWPDANVLVGEVTVLVSASASFFGLEFNGSVFGETGLCADCVDSMIGSGISRA